MDDRHALTSQIVDAGLTVHKLLGPGLLESTYEHCLTHELLQRGIRYQAQFALPVIYKGTRLDAGYRVNLLVADVVIIELKSVDNILPIHKAQLLTHMKLSRIKIGLLINFNVVLFKDGLHRFIL